MSAEAPACVYERAIEEPILPEAPIMQTMKGCGRRVRVGWRVGGGWEWWVRKADWMGWVPQLDGDMVIFGGEAVDSDGWRFYVFFEVLGERCKRKGIDLHGYLPQNWIHMYFIVSDLFFLAQLYY